MRAEDELRCLTAITTEFSQSQSQSLVQVTDFLFSIKWKTCASPFLRVSCREGLSVVINWNLQ